MGVETMSPDLQIIQGNALDVLRNRRIALGIELNPEYIEIAKRRLSAEQINLI